MMWLSLTGFLRFLGDISILNRSILSARKKGTIIGLVDIAFRLSHPRYHKKKNFEFVINILLDNGYPLSLIFHVINERLKKLFF